MKLRKAAALLLLAALLLGLAACGENSGSTESSEKGTESTSRAATQQAETQESLTQPESQTEETEESKTVQLPANARELILAAAQASNAADGMTRVRDAFGAVGVDLSAYTSGAELLKAPELALISGVETEAWGTELELFDRFTVGWEEEYTHLSEDIIKPERKAELLAAWNEWDNTQKILQFYNTPQMIMRAYAKAQPGDLLIGVTPTKNGTRDKSLCVIKEVNPVFLADGANLNIKDSEMVLVGEKGTEKILTFEQAYDKYYGLPYRLAQLEEAVPTPGEVILPAPAETPVLQVGFGREDITSDMPLALGGYGNANSRMSTKTIIPEDRLMATAVAISDGSRTELLFTMDLLYTPADWTDLLGIAIEKATGIPGEQIHVSATHNHSGPDVADAYMPEAVKTYSPYYDFWLEQMVKVAEDALADLAPVKETGIAAVEVEHMNWVRHWRTAEGVVAGVNFTKGTNMGATEFADPEMQLIRFVREGRKDVVMVNWQAHSTCCSTAGTDFGKANRPNISTDYPGYMRRFMEKQDEDILVAYYQGACGNVVLRTQDKAMLQYNANCETPTVLGERLGRYALKALENVTVVETGAVQSLRQQHIAISTKDDAATRDIEQDAVSVGSTIAFVTAGYEMFNVNGLAAKARSPFAMTFVLSCSQGNAYIPSFQAFHYDILGPEQDTAFEAGGNISKMAAGTGEDLVDGIAGMLGRLWSNLGLEEKDIVKPLADKVQHVPEAELK